ncbi:MAG: arginine N-succinyltransferase, partial [Polymorphobacter sp.]
AMLEAEGFSFDGYVDIFDGGPTMTVRTDAVRSVRDSRRGDVMALVEDHGTMARALLATGQLRDFRAWIGHAGWVGGNEAAGLFLPRGEAEAVGVNMGDKVRHVGF